MFFRPILAGATVRDRIVACVGALAGIALTAYATSLISAAAALPLPLLAAPMGASALLLFAVPASPLAQPWSIVGGNVISTLVGIAVCRTVPDPMIAAGTAVALAIAAMSVARCLHPPGGAAALTMVLGGPAVAAQGLLPAVAPIALDSLLLVALGWLFHRLSGHAYPHVPATAPVNPHGTRDAPPQLRSGFRDEDVDAALADLGETFDIDRADLDRLLRRVELRAVQREQGALACADIMSRDVVSVPADAPPEAARTLLLQHGVRTLPVVDPDRRVVGSIGLRELFGPGERVADRMSRAATTTPGRPALDLLPALTDGRTHAVIVLDGQSRIAGIVTQTDLLAALSRPRPQAPAGR